VSDDSGVIKYGGEREGITNYLSPDETRRSNFAGIGEMGLKEFTRLKNRRRKICDGRI
jgi:hypothetical protein